MNRLLNYITHGRGIGAFLIFVLAFVVTLYFCINAKIMLTASIPHIQAAADEILPIVIKNGKIVTPQNTVKEINLFGKDATSTLPFVIDTTQDTLNADSLNDGIYLSRTHMYFINHNETRTVKLTDTLDLPRADYTASMQTAIKWFVVFSAISGTLFLFILYYIIVIFYAFCGNLISIMLKKQTSFDFKLRLNSILFIVVYGFSFMVEKLGGNLNLLVFFIIMIGLQLYAIKKIFSINQKNTN